MAVADASFNTSMETMSAGLMELSTLLLLVLLPEMATPSNNVERFVAVQGVDTTDADRDTATRSSGILGHLHTGGTSLQSLVERGDYGLFQFVTRHADYGTGQVTAFHRTVSHYYYFVQHLIIGSQLDIDNT